MAELNTLIEQHRRERDQLVGRPAVPRELAAGLSEALRSSLVKVIIGPRRAGKSTLAFQALAGRKFAYLNFEDDSLRGVPSSDELVEALARVYGKTDFLFFDEIQNFPSWESFVNKLHRRGHNLILTGSNSRLLSRELASALTGRHLAFELLPFSFREFMVATGAQGDEGFRDYLVWGGFPEVVLARAERSSYLRNLFDSVVLRDIVTRHRVRRATAIHDLLTLLLNSAASRFSAHSLARSLGTLSIATIQRFISHACEAYLIQDLQPYFFKPRQRIKADRKVYAFDNGFVSAKSQPATSNTARLLENLVFVELVRRGSSPNLSLYYYQTRSGYEVDFLVREGAVNRELVQVTQSLASLKTREREIRALFQAADELGVKRLTVVTLDDEDTIRAEGREIRVLPCAKWLLEERP